MQRKKQCSPKVRIATWVDSNLLNSHLLEIHIFLISVTFSVAHNNNYGGGNKHFTVFEDEMLV